MKYLYRCPSCGSQRSLFRNVEERRDAVNCECGTPCELTFTPAFHFTADRTVDKAENKYADGFDLGTRRENWKVWDKEYEKNTPDDIIPVKKGVSMDALAKTYYEIPEHVPVAKKQEIIAKAHAIE